MSDNHIIKKCSYCSRTFTLPALLEDPQVRPIGMAFYGDESEEVFYFFQHEERDCGTSFLINVEEFRRMIDERIPEQKLAESDCCEQHCVNIKDLSECRQECHFAPFRRFLLKMIADKKRRARFAATS